MEEKDLPSNKIREHAISCMVNVFSMDREDAEKELQKDTKFAHSMFIEGILRYLNEKGLDK